MWLSKPIYERLPQFYFLFGLLFVAGGLYLGFDFVLAFYYVGFGLVSCSWGVATFLMRMQHRQIQAVVKAAAEEAASVKDSTAAADGSVGDSLHEHSAQN